MSERGENARWDLAPERMKGLLEETRRLRGQSLGQDAWRRLRRRPSNSLCLVFLAGFGVLALFAPLLPLPSPTAFESTGVPEPPVWWPSQTVQASSEDGGLELGSRVTESRGGGAWDDGWRHRTVLLFESTRPAQEIPQLQALVEQLSGRSARVEQEAEGNEVTAIAVSIPARDSDQLRVAERSTGGRGEVTVWSATPRAGQVAREAWVAELPLDAARITTWDAQARGGQRRLALRWERGEEKGSLVYRFHGEARATRPDAIVVNGRLLAEEGGASLPSWQADVNWPEDLASVPAPTRLRWEQGGEGHDLFSKQRYEAKEHRTQRKASLGERIEQKIGTTAWPPQSTFVGQRGEDGYPFGLNAMDRWLVSARSSLFGLWQARGLAGTDAAGRDLAARILWGSRTSILVGLAATLCSLILGVGYGAIAGLVGGRVDNAMMRLVDVLYSIPFIFVVIFVITIVGDSRVLLEERYGIDREVVFFLIIGAIYWLTMARVVRGQVLSMRNAEFLLAARTLGASTPRLLVSHVLPNVLSIVIVYLTLTIPAVMLFEAFLSFLGLGIEPPKVSWGLLASDAIEAISPLRSYWWLVLFPALAMGGTLLALNVLGDGLRDALDPKLRGKE